MVEAFVLLLFSFIMILIVLRGTRNQHSAFSIKTLKFTLTLILLSIIWDSVFLWSPLSQELKHIFFIGAALTRLSIFSYGWWLLAKALTVRQKVTDRTIITAVVGYLFIGIIWSFIYLMIWHIDPQAFHTSIVKDYEFRSWNLVMYFSFMTLTTVGYGDIIPINKWAMVLSNFEAMTGSIYLTVVIARLVSLYQISE
jgi:hypothetical protein